MARKRSDPRLDRQAERRLMTAMAVAMVATMAVLGVVYLALWASAADDLSRLLPASTRAYAASPAPWAATTRALGLPIWRDREAMQAAVLRDGYLTNEQDGEIAGLPVESVRELVRTMDSIAAAVVPTSEGDSLLVFVELQDSTQRKRALARLAPALESVDRRVGFRIDKIRSRAWHTLTGSDIDPPRVVDLDPWIVLSWGPPGGLEELLEARVEGRRDALFRRAGFDLGRDDRGDLRLAIDARSAWRLFAGATEPRPGGLIDFLDLVTVGARVDRGRDLLTLRAEISDRELTRMLAKGLSRAEHPMVARAPSDTLFVLSATGPEIAPLVAVLRTLLFRLRRDFLPSADVDAVAANILAAASELPAMQVEAAFPNEICLFALPDPDDPLAAPKPVVLIHSPAIEAIALHLADSIPSHFGDGYAHGQVVHRDERLHLERRHPSSTEPDAAPELRLAWRQRGGLIELAPDVATLDRFAETTRTIADTPRLAAALQGLPVESGLLWIGDRRLLSLADGRMAALLQDRLRPDFSFGATLDVDGADLVLRANVGLWTLATAVASGSRSEVDAFSLIDLDPQCRQAYEAFCTLYPRAAPCRPLSLGRRARLEEVCRELNRRSGR